MTTAPVLPGIISADSHITEPPNTYIDHIDRAWREKAPRMERHPQMGDVFVVDGMKRPVPMGLVAAAGKPAEEIRVNGARFEELSADANKLVQQFVRAREPVVFDSSA